VCLSCRRHLHATTRQRKDGDADDWLANFNDLSAEQETKPWHTSRSSRSKLLQASDNQRVPDRLEVETKGHVDSESKPQAPSFEDLRAKLNYATRGLRFGLGSGAQESKLDDTSSQALEGIPRKAEVDDHDGQPVRQAYESVLAGILAEQDRGQDNSVSTKGAKDVASESLSEVGPRITWGARKPKTQIKFGSGGFGNSPGELADQQAQQLAAAATAGSNKGDSGTSRGRLGLKSLWRKLQDGDDSPPVELGKVTPQESEKSQEDRPAILVESADDDREGTQRAKRASTPRLRSQRTLSDAGRRIRPKERRRIEAANRQRLSSEQQEPESEGRNLSTETADNKHFSLEQQEPESDGRTLSEVMVGRQLAQAMRSSDGARPSNERVDDSGLPRIYAKDLQITPLNIEQPPVPGLAHGLDKVLFNPGVTSLQDQHSRVYNFDPYLQHIMPVEEFDFNALQQYKTSSQDSALSELAKQYEKKYVGSTSSMTSTLSHFHYLLSGWRDLNLGMLSRQFPEKQPTFTQINRAPTAIFLRWKNGTYAIDADKEHDSGNILMMLGKSMEKLLTLSKSDYERYRKSASHQISEEERKLPEAYEYTTMGDFLMRSQLDAYDPRLPGTGMFDIKTRAVSSIRMSTSDYKPMLGYEILTHQGQWESYEREYYEMMRSTMLKYMLQARMGRMDGIFTAYHNVQRMFGFQYMPIAELDRAIHGQIDRCLGDQEFKFSIDLLNKALEEATARFPNKSLRLHFETRASPVTAMYIFAEPMEEEQIDKIQSKSKEKIAEFERKMMGIEAKEQTADPEPSPSPEPTAPAAPTGASSHSPLYAATLLVGSTVNGARVERPEHLKPHDDWSIEYLLKEIENPSDAWATYEQCKATRQKLFARLVETGDEDGAESLEAMEPNLEMHESDGSVRTFDDYYREMLRQLAEKGREYRRKMDEAEEGQEKVVFREKVPETETVAGEPVSTGAEKAVVDVNDESRINGVEDYMEWMCKPSQNESASGETIEWDKTEIRGVDDYMSWMFKGRAW